MSDSDEQPPPIHVQLAAINARLDEIADGMTLLASLLARVDRAVRVPPDHPDNLQSFLNRAAWKGTLKSEDVAREE